MNGLQVLVGNKCDMDESKRAVPFSKGKALADELGIPFFETSAKNNINVTEVCLAALATSPAPIHDAGGVLCTWRMLLMHDVSDVDNSHRC